MNKLSLLRELPIRGKINPKTIGYVHSGGEISFATSEAAHIYAKNRVVSALNYENGKEPFERGILVHDNIILAQKDGNRNGVMIVPKSKYSGKNYVFVHGHPDEEISQLEKFMRKLISLFNKNYKSDFRPKESVTYPVSFGDYTSLVNNPCETKVIAYNSKGEFSSLTKTSDFCKDSYSDFKSIESEYNMDVPSGYIYQLMKGIKSFFKSFIPYEKSERMTINAAKVRSKNISDFWENNEKLCGVKYETNYGKT